jgi:hypothetical protein
MESWPTFAKALESKLNPLLPKGHILPIWAELNEVLPIFKHSIHIIAACGNISILSTVCLDNLQANLEVVVFTLICSQNKGADTTCFI